MSTRTHLLDLMATIIQKLYNENDPVVRTFLRDQLISLVRELE